MEWINFESFPLLTAILVFVIAASLVWIAGDKISALADGMAEKTGIGRAFIGVLLLGGITSLPEVATTVTATLSGNAGMAVSNILGGVSMQVTILAVVDFWVRKQPLSTATSTTVLAIEGGSIIVMLAFAAVFMLLPSIPVFSFGLDTFFLFLLFLFSLYLVHRFNRFRWIAYDHTNQKNISLAIDKLHALGEKLSTAAAAPENQKIPVRTYLQQKGLALLLYSLLILVAGFFVVKSSEAMAATTGIDASFAGLVLVAITTSLPEISTTIGAIKRKRYDMAFSNIFGTNLFDVALLFIADLLFTKGPVLDELTNFAVVATLHAIVLTAIFLTGIMLKSKRTMFSIGYDSVLILLAYISGIVLLYGMSN